MTEIKESIVAAFKMSKEIVDNEYPKLNELEKMPAVLMLFNAVLTILSKKDDKIMMDGVLNTLTSKL